MSTCYLDASAWVKRYFEEPGSAWVDRFWDSGAIIACSTLGLVEVLSVVARRRASANADPAGTRELLHEVEADFAGFHKVHFDDPVLGIARLLPSKYALRGADTIHLASLLRLRGTRQDGIVLVASDEELLKAAVAEGVRTVDPRTAPAGAK